jgi:hypothetical protein
VGLRPVPSVTSQVRFRLPSRNQVIRCARRATISWSRRLTVDQPPLGSQPIRRFAEGSSTATQPRSCLTIGTVTFTPLISGVRNARAWPPGASYTGSGRVGCSPRVSAAVEPDWRSAGNPRGDFV